MWQDCEELVNLLVVEEPKVFQLEQLRRQQVLSTNVYSLLRLSERLLERKVNELLRSREVGVGFIVEDAEAASVERLHHCETPFLGYSYLNANGACSLFAVVLWKVNSNHRINVGLVGFVLAQEVLNVSILREGELCVRKNWRLKLHHVHALRLTHVGDSLARLAFFFWPTSLGGLSCRGRCHFRCLCRFISWFDLTRTAATPLHRCFLLIGRCFFFWLVR